MPFARRCHTSTERTCCCASGQLGENKLAARAEHDSQNNASRTRNASLPNLRVNKAAAHIEHMLGCVITSTAIERPHPDNRMPTILLYSMYCNTAYEGVLQSSVKHCSMRLAGRNARFQRRDLKGHYLLGAAPTLHWFLSCAPLHPKRGGPCTYVTIKPMLSTQSRVESIGCWSTKGCKLLVPAVAHTGASPPRPCGTTCDRRCPRERTTWQNGRAMMALARIDSETRQTSFSWCSGRAVPSFDGLMASIRAKRRL